MKTAGKRAKFRLTTSPNYEFPITFALEGESFPNTQATPAPNKASGASLTIAFDVFGDEYGESKSDPLKEHTDLAQQTFTDCSVFCRAFACPVVKVHRLLGPIDNRESRERWVTPKSGTLTPKATERARGNGEISNQLLAISASQELCTQAMHICRCVSWLIRLLLQAWHVSAFCHC